MAIDMAAIQVALGDKFDPEGDYVVCGYNDLALMVSKGYALAGTIQDPSPEDRELTIFDRRKPPPKKKGFVK